MLFCTLLHWYNITTATHQLPFPRSPILFALLPFKPTTALRTELRSAPYALIYASRISGICIILLWGLFSCISLIEPSAVVQVIILFFSLPYGLYYNRKFLVCQDKNRKFLVFVGLHKIQGE